MLMHFQVSWGLKGSRLKTVHYFLSFKSQGNTQNIKWIIFKCTVQYEVCSHGCVTVTKTGKDLHVLLQVHH